MTKETKFCLERSLVSVKEVPACTVVVCGRDSREDSAGLTMSVSLCYRAFDTLGLFHALLCKWRLSVVPGILITSGSQTDSCL